MLNYFNELFGGYPGQMCITTLSDLVDILGTVCAKWNCRAVMRSGSVCLYDSAACTLHDCFILKKEDAVRFVIFKKAFWGSLRFKKKVPCGLKRGGALRLGFRRAVH